MILDSIPPFDPNTNYYKLYWQTFLQNNGLNEQYMRLSEDRNDLLEQIIKFKEFYDQNDTKFYEERANGRKKHNRRTAGEIPRSYVCPYLTCEKTYGSEGSLNLHVKIKHGGGNKTDREKMAKTLVLLKLKGQEIPVVNINLPPGVLEQAALEANVEMSDEQFVELHNDATKSFKAFINSE